MGIYDRDHRQNDPWKKDTKGIKQYKISDEKAKTNPTINWFNFISILIMIFVWTMLNENKDQKQITNMTEQETMKKEGVIKLNQKFIKYDIKENGEFKIIANMLKAGCKDDLCEIKKDFEYVTKIPYMITDKAKKPEEVINMNGGDCDEKSFLFASLLIEQKHNCIIIFTKDHAFMAVNVKNENDLKKPNAYIEIEQKKYFYAETTAEGSYIGWYNNIHPKEFEGIYDINNRKEVNLNKIIFKKS